MVLLIAKLAAITNAQIALGTEIAGANLKTTYSSMAVPTVTFPTLAEHPQITLVRETYTWLVPLMIVILLMAIIGNSLIVISSPWLNPPVTPYLRLCVSLAAADTWAASLLTAGLVVNSYLSIVIRVQKKSDCFAAVLEVFRIGGMLTSDLHLFALAINQFVGITWPLKYKVVFKSTFYYLYVIRSGDVTTPLFPTITIWVYTSFQDFNSIFIVLIRRCVKAQLRACPWATPRGGWLFSCNRYSHVRRSQQELSFGSRNCGSFQMLVTTKRIRAMIVMLWLAPVFFTFAWFVAFENDGFRHPKCHHRFYLRMPFRLTVFIIFMVPLIATLSIHARILFTLFKAKVEYSHDLLRRTQGTRTQLQGKLKLVWTTLLIVSTFSLSWGLCVLYFVLVCRHGCTFIYGQNVDFYVGFYINSTVNGFVSRFLFFVFFSFIRCGKIIRFGIFSNRSIAKVVFVAE
ncbi:unnamed protein product [Toxocara canis]|uniref:G_PROTEIN_RECEP_F1_2 domain-containing protein n=1 Tax=Toxocara canis TaxID=6265 RepID=A0A183UAM7_TOXCA|nr:unnamed protein product [Toxocara canis]